VVWSGYGDYYPLVLEEYASSIDDSTLPNVSQSPAWSLFGIHCELDQLQQQHQGDKGNEGEQKAPHLSDLCQQYLTKSKTPDPVLIRWSYSHYNEREQTEQTNAASENREAKKEAKPKTEPDTKKWYTAAHIAQLLVMQGLYSEPEFDQLFRVKTPPIEHIRASSLMGQKLDDPDTHTMLNDQIVLVGYFLGSGLDVVATPLHGAIPGVFRHAMALDNLIQLDTDYWHMPTEDVVFGLDANDLIELVVNVVCIIIVLYVRERQIRFEEVRKRINALNGMVRGREKLGEAQYQRLMAEQQRVLVAKRDKSRRYLPLFLVPLVLMGISIYISVSVYTYGMANWYTLPLIFLFSIPAFLSILINDIRLNCVITQISNQSNYFGIKASLLHRVGLLRHWIAAKSAKEKVMPKVILGLLICGMVFSGFLQAQPRIIEYILPDIELCDENDDCIDVSAGDLDESKKVEGFNTSTNTVGIIYQDKLYWVHLTEVKLNVEAQASKTCAMKAASVDTNELSKPKDLDSNVMMGVGEDC
jgi:hypothetical protein